MSKRLAEGLQGGSDRMHEFGMMGTPEEKPQRATAAQLANRKIREIRRRPRGTTPTGGAGEPSGAFSQLSSAPAPSFSAPTNQSTGFSFGQSQSFPGATATPSQPTQGDSAPFSFGGNNSTSFNFGGGFGAPASNPFANNPFTAGNSAPAQPSSTTGSVSFGGFGSQPAAQPASQPTSQPTPQPAFSFGAPQNASSSATTGLFGQPAAPKATGNAVADSMQMSPDAKPKNIFASSSSLPSKNIFGDSGASNVFTSKPATPAGNPFGGLSLPAAAAAAAAEKPPSDKPEAFAAKPAFANQAPTATSQAQPFGSLFGATPAASTPSEPEKPTTNNFFAPKAATPAAAPSNPFMFSKPAASEPEKATTTQVASNNMFSPKPSAEPSTSGSMFAVKPAEQSSTPKLFAPKALTNDATSTPAASQPFKNPFASTTMSQPPILNPATGQTSITNIFTPTEEKPAVPGPFGNVFKPLSKDATKSLFVAGGFGAFSTTSNSAQPATATPNLFAPKPVTEQATDKPAETPQPFKNLFGTSSTTSKPAEPVAAASNPFAPKSATEQPAPSPVKPFANLFGGKTAAPQPTPVKALTATPSSIASVPKPEAPVPKPSIPATASKDITENAELLWKIRGLDNHFKQEVMKYQPGTDSFDNLILHYIRVRNGMGAPIEGVPELQAKKVVEKSVHLDGPNGSATSSVFAKSFSSPSPSLAQPGAASTPAPSATGNTFAKSMSNGTAASPAPKLGGNMFAQPASPAPAASPAPKLTGNMFGQPASPAPADSPAPKLAGNMFAQSTSTAPAASPAPKLAGNMFAQSASTSGPNGSAAPAPPKFGNGVGAVDFMAQFKKQAEKTMAEEKAKRKAEEFDSDEDDEEEWERRDAEQQREKRAKLEVGSQKKSVFRNGKFEWVDVDEPASAETSSNAVKPVEKPATNSLSVPADNAVFSAASPASSTGSIFESSSRPLPASENIFGRLTPKPSDVDKDSDDSGDEGKASSKRPAEEDASTDDDFASTLRNSKRTKPSEQTDAAKSSMDTPLPAPTPAAGRSLFDRIQSPAPTSTPQKETSTSTSSLFSASFGQSTSFGKSISFGQNNATPATDKTWKPTSPIKFSTDSVLSATSAPASTLASTQPSSGVNSGDATPDEEAAPGEVFDMSQANAGEEEETLVFECRARAFKITTGWTSQGTGIARLLKHPETGRARIVLRADPGGNVILNTLLKKELEYSRQSNSVQFLVPQADSDQAEHWAIRVKAESIEELYSKIQEIKY